MLTLHGELMGMARSRRRGAADEALNLVGLSDRAGDQVGKFSKGMQQRLGLGVALLGEPALIMLDEPTSALDPVGRVDVRSIIRTAADRGAAVFLNSHLLSEVEAGVRSASRSSTTGGSWRAASSTTSSGSPRRRSASAGSMPSDLPAIEQFGPPSLDGDMLAIRPMDPERVPDLVAALVSMGAKIHEVRAGRGSLEQRFLDLVARDRPPAGTPSAQRLR